MGRRTANRVTKKSVQSQMVASIVTRLDEERSRQREQQLTDPEAGAGLVCRGEDQCGWDHVST